MAGNSTFRHKGDVTAGKIYSMEICKMMDTSSGPIPELYCLIDPDREGLPTRIKGPLDPLESIHGRSAGQPNPASSTRHSES